MAGLEILTTAEIGSLSRDMDIFSGSPVPDPELIEKKLYPPLPICSDALIWGFHILRAAESWNLRQVNCLVIPSCPRARMLSLALKLENRTGNFSWPEKQRMLAFLGNTDGRSAGDHRPSQEGSSGDEGAFVDEDPFVGPAVIELFSELSRLIEGHRDPQLAARITAFAALPQGLKALVAEEQADLKTAVRVQSLPEAVFDGLRGSELSFSQRRQFLNELFEVSRKSRLSQTEIGDLAKRAFGDPQPIETVHSLRFPMLTELDRRFAAVAEQPLKGSGVRLSPPPYFEGEAFSVEFGFNSAKSLSRKLSALHALEGRLDALFELLH
jgi:hypothetical protein